MSAMNATSSQRLAHRPLVIIDFELVFDVWSLLCCCVRACPDAPAPFPTQQVYPQLFNKPI